MLRQEDKEILLFSVKDIISCLKEISRMRRLASGCQLKILEGIVIIQHTGAVVKDLVLGCGLTSLFKGSVPISLQLVL
jgi:hypothetical protein